MTTLKAEWRRVRERSPEVQARQLDTGEWLIRFGGDQYWQEWKCDNVSFEAQYEFVEESSD